MISDEQARFFRENGYLVLSQLLAAAELEALRSEMQVLVTSAVERTGDADFRYREHALTGEQVPFRIEYVIDKSAACRRLLGHPFVLGSVEKLQGPSFIPTWDSMVFKLEGAGAAIPWHRDAGLEQLLDERPIFNVDFYLDASDRTNCLWAIPGSHRFDEDEAQERLAELSADGFGTQFDGGGAVSLELEPGDVLFHDILVLHGSPAAQSRLRRVLYYEFRPIDVELAIGPHTPDYIPLKQQVLAACQRERAQAFPDEEPFRYRPEPPVPDGEPASFRFPHEQFWR
ncbi:MAG: phytanoyl-CoA dioxygenase family protein [Actinobacteria bacterium]|nr:phytanoyl-CoA dioxygenase family protein [Actinomycetota bacterium]